MKNSVIEMIVGFLCLAFFFAIFGPIAFNMGLLMLGPPPHLAVFEYIAIFLIGSATLMGMVVCMFMLCIASKCIGQHVLQYIHERNKNLHS